MKVTALAPWFGSNRTLAENVGRALDGCAWVGVPFAGGMSELDHIKAKNIVATDLHHHVINLACVVKSDGLRRELIRQLDRTPFHATELDMAQERCKLRERDSWSGTPDLTWAADYFVTAWMGRSSLCGIDDQFCGGISSRWNANGGGSNVRFRNATRSLVEWGRVMRRCEFRCMDGFAFLARVEDAVGHGVYCDPPFPGPGDRYDHNCGDTADEQRAWHTRLRDDLTRFAACRVVCRFYDHPLIRELYPEAAGWAWHHFAGRKQSNAAGPEVLLVRNGGLC